MQPTGIVFDSSTIVSAIRDEKVARKCIAEQERQSIPRYISFHTWTEHQKTLFHPDFLGAERNAHLSPELINERLDEYANHETTRLITHVKEYVSLERDPKDAKFINLALQEGANRIVTRDKDLLSLMDTTQKSGKLFQEKFPNLKIVRPEAMLQELERLQGREQETEKSLEQSQEQQSLQKKNQGRSL